jgi:hypothetical protein
MKKKTSRLSPKSERDTMRPEYDFSAGIRGATAARYGEGAHTAVIDPEVLDGFPDGAAVLRQQRRAASKRKSA